MRRLSVLGILMLGMTLLTACAGQRAFKNFEEVTTEGRWTVNDMLIRSYDVSLREAYDAMLNYYERNGWTIERRSLEQTEAMVGGVQSDGTYVRFEAWAPQGEATDIGVKVGEGNQAASTRILNAFEQRLPGQRITANLPEAAE